MSITNSSFVASTATPTSVRLINMDILQDRVKNLEVENRSLRQEATKLATDTMECEDKEKELVTGVIKQLSELGSWCGNRATLC